jgi:hypothetical protein
MPIVWSLVSKMTPRYVEKLLAPPTPARGFSKLAFSPQHQDAACGLRARMVSAIAKVSEAGKITEGYKLKGKNAYTESQYAAAIHLYRRGLGAEKSLFAAMPKRISKFSAFPFHPFFS